MTLFSPRIPYAIHLFLLLLKSPSGLVCFRQVICASVDSVYEDRVRMVLSKTYKIPLLKIIFTHWAVVYSWDIFLIRSCAIPVIEWRILIFLWSKTFISRLWKPLSSAYPHSFSVHWHREGKLLYPMKCQKSIHFVVLSNDCLDIFHNVPLNL